MLLVLAAWGCKGEVPVKVDDPAGEETPNSTDDNAEKETGFVPLKVADFTAFVAKPTAAKSTWSVGEPDLIKTTGIPRGYLYTKKTYANFTLRGEFRFVPTPLETPPEKYNTGFLIYVPDEHKIWPRSLEVQGRYDLMGEIKSNAKDLTVEVPVNDQAAREAARKPIGEWNTIEIVSQDGAVTSILNGTKIAQSKPGELKSGHLGLQAEDFAVEFRNLRIREE
jgi:hypothetical protein